jgi:hypothetical protein
VVAIGTNRKEIATKRRRRRLLTEGTGAFSLVSVQMLLVFMVEQGDINTSRLVTFSLVMLQNTLVVEVAHRYLNTNL